MYNCGINGCRHTTQTLGAMLNHEHEHVVNQMGDSITALRAERDNLAAANAELREALETIRSYAHSAIGHVAAANYPERENEAHQSVNDCIDAVLAKGAK